MLRPDHCPFCRIIQGSAPAEIVERGSRYLVLKPLIEHAPGHVLVIPTDHIEDAVEAPIRSGHVMEWAARYAQTVGPCNILTSVGADATQTVRHLHVHVIPRKRNDDGLHPDWPWCRPGTTDDMPG